MVRWALWTVDEYKSAVDSALSHEVDCQIKMAVDKVPLGQRSYSCEHPR